MLKATVYGKNGKRLRTILKHADVKAMTDCSDLLEKTLKLAQKVDSTSVLSSFSLCADDYVTLGLEDEDFVTEAVLRSKSGDSVVFSDISGVTFSAKYICESEINESSVQVHHHVHPDQEHLLDLSVIHFEDGPLTKQELKQCHQWGVFNGKQLRDAPDFVIPKRLQSGLPEHFVAVSHAFCDQEQVTARFDVSIGSHGFMHTAAPFKSLESGKASIAFHLDAETVYVHPHHQDAIGDHLFDAGRVAGSIGTPVSLEQDGDVAISLRHSDESTLELLDQGVCPTKLELHQCAHQMAVLDASHLHNTETTRCSKGHVYKHMVTPVDDDWTLNKVRVKLHNAPVSSLKMALLQSESKTLLLSCTFLFSQDKRNAFEHQVIKPFGANVQGTRPIGQGTFEALFDSVKVSLVWNQQTYTHQLEHEWFIESSMYPLDRTRFGDLLIQALNVTRDRPGVAADLPRVNGLNRPQFVGLEMSWKNDRNAKVTYSTGSGRQLRYEKLWYEEEGDESGWLPHVVGTIGQVETGGRQNFNPVSGDSGLTLVFDLGGPNSINNQISDSLAQRRITMAGDYRLLPAGAGPHPHTVSVDSDGNGISSMQFGHVHPVIGGIVQEVFGHIHDWQSLDA